MNYKKKPEGNKKHPTANLKPSMTSQNYNIRRKRIADVTVCMCLNLLNESLQELNQLW